MYQNTEGGGCLAEYTAKESLSHTFTNTMHFSIDYTMVTRVTGLEHTVQRIV